VLQDILKSELKILLVDDDPDDYLIAKDLLLESPLRLKIDWCSTYQDALAAIAEKRHDVYFFDYHLGADSGHQLLIAAKKLVLDKPIIMMTGFGDFDADAKALQAGAADYLVKGNITTAMLERSIRHALERTRILKALEDQISESKRAEAALREAEAQQRAMLEAIPDFIFVLDSEGTYLQSKASYEQPFITDPTGSRAEQIPYITPELAQLQLQHIRHSLLNSEVVSYEYHLQEPIGTRYYEGRIVPIDKERVLFLARDITQRKVSEAALQESEERYALAAKGANDGLWDWDIEKDTVYYSMRWKTMLGYSEEDIGNTLDEWLKRVHSEDAERVQEELQQHLEGFSQSFESEHRVLHKDNSYRWMLSRALAVRNETGKAERMAGWQTDSSGRVAAYDALTNLPNRTLFLDRLQRALGRTKRDPSHNFAVLYIDLDGFKLVNDTLGHAMGDLLLVEAAARLNGSLRLADDIARMMPEKGMQDTVARFGGDEFAVLIEDFHNLQEVISIVQRLQQALSSPYVLVSQSAYSTASIGVALGNADYQNPEEILRDADIAMYRAKHDGKARYTLFDNNMHQQIRARFSLESDLRQALSQNEFRVFYQPIIDLQAERIQSFEALLRWQRSEQMVSPAEFIPLSEETGIIVPLEAWVLEESLRQLKAWHHLDPNLNISVNVSSKHFESLDLLKHVEQALSKSGVDAKHLALEVTEGILNQQEERVKHVLGTLRDMGIRIYLDDFGTGYSSLSRLHALPIDVLKIDRSFMFGAESTVEKTRMVEAILLMASAMKLQVVAEGIENTQQKDLLKILGCQYGQGYLFSRPISAEQVVPLLEGLSLETT
jgi:diguanylate cyclase (GGDEF)-like protein/PAS domain S-box-containing protein